MPDSLTQSSGSLDELEDFVGALAIRWRDAWNTHEVEPVLDLMTEDVIYLDSAWHRPMHGHDDVREFLEVSWRAFPDMVFDMVGDPYLHPHKAGAVFHWRGTGTHTGDLDPPGIGPTGRPVDCQGTDLQEYRDGRISRVWMLWDMADVMRQLRVLPKRNSQAERALIALGQGR